MLGAMHGNKLAGWIGAAVLVVVLISLVAIVTHGDKASGELTKYTARASVLESKERNDGLDIAEKSELAELKARIGKMRADGIR